MSVGVLMKGVGIVMIASGIVLFVRGATHLSDPPYPPAPRYVRVMSGQVQDVGAGIMGVMLGVVAYRNGKSRG